MYKKIIVTNETAKSLRNGPVIKNIGINTINVDGKTVNSFFLKLMLSVTELFII